MTEAGKRALQCELEFYKNLLSNHEKQQKLASSNGIFHSKFYSPVAINHGNPLVKTHKLTSNNRHCNILNSVQSTSSAPMHYQNSSMHKTTRSTWSNQSKILSSKSMLLNSRKHPYLPNAKSPVLSKVSEKRTISSSLVNLKKNELLHEKKIDSEKQIISKGNSLNQNHQKLMNEIKSLTELLKQKSSGLSASKNLECSKINHLKTDENCISNFKSSVKMPVDSRMCLDNKDSNKISSPHKKINKSVVRCKINSSENVSHLSTNLNLNVLNNKVRGNIKVNSVNTASSFKSLSKLQSNSINDSSKSKSMIVLNKQVLRASPKASVKFETSPKMSSTLKTPVRVRIVKMPVSSSKRKVIGPKLIPYKHKIANKSPYVQNSTLRKLFQINTNKSIYKSQVKQTYFSKNCSFLKMQQTSGWNKTSLKTNRLNSKYKIVNGARKSMTISESSDTKRNSLSKRKVLEDSLASPSKQKNMSLNLSNTKIGMNTSRLYLKHKNYLIKRNSNMIKVPTSFMIKKYISPRNSHPSSSKYRIFNKPSSNLQSKALKQTLIGSNKINNQNSSMDLDLLLEIAAEKNKSLNNTFALTSDKPILIKRIYKSKNAIINKNACSVQTRIAKTIKTKYSILNKKHSWPKQSISKRLISPKSFRGHLLNTRFHRKTSAVSFYNPRIKRNFSLSKIGHRIPSSCFRKQNYGRFLNLKNKFISYGSIKSAKAYKRPAVNQSMFLKASNTFTSTPISKTLASRALHRSINRVLTASVKKETSKVTKYCMFYNRFGRCNKGLKCPYIHDPSKIAVCTRFLRGTCKSESCLFSHEVCPGKMAICSFFLVGSCSKTDCPYRHETLSPDAKLCKAFVQGYCPDGKQCKQAHILVCPQFVLGHCEKGDACAFPHPPSKEKKNIPKLTEKKENLEETEEYLMEKMSRYFEPLKELVIPDKCVNRLAVSRSRNLPEQPSFIALSLSDNET